MKKCLFVLLLCLFTLLQGEPAKAAKVNWEDYEQIQVQGMEDNLGEYIKKLMSGKEVVDKKGVLEKVGSILSLQIKGQKNELLKLFLLGILAGIFSNFSISLGRKDLGDAGFYIVFVLLFSTISVSFFSVSKVAYEAIEGLLNFMKILVPSFAMTMSLSSDVNTSVAFYQISLIGMSLVEGLILKILLPGVQIYFLLSLTNQVTREARFSRLAQLLRSLLKWTSRTVLGLVLGLQGIQMLISPMVDRVEKSALLNAARSIPGVGNGIRGMAETILGTGAVIKSAVGVGGVVGVCVICGIPIIKLCVFTLVYKVSAAMVQPVADRRVAQSVYATAESGRLLLSLVVISSLMFALSLAIVIGALNNQGV